MFPAASEDDRQTDYLTTNGAREKKKFLGGEEFAADAPFGLNPVFRLWYSEPNLLSGERTSMPGNWASWALVIVGGLMILAEVVLGAATGFDFALVGLSLAVGGSLGLLFNSAIVALFSAGAISFVYLAFFRSRIRSKLMAPGLPSNADALLGSRAIVTMPITPDAAGQVKIGPEIWRAVLSPTAKEAREPGASVIVESVDGVTLIVR